MHEIGGLPEGLLLVRNLLRSYGWMCLMLQTHRNRLVLKESIGFDSTAI